MVFSSFYIFKDGFVVVRVFFNVVISDDNKLIRLVWISRKELEDCLVVVWQVSILQ